MVHYMDHLDPDVPASKLIVPWQKTTDFDYDFGYARDIVTDITKSIHDHATKGTFQHIHASIVKFIQSLNSAFPNTKRALNWSSLSQIYWDDVESEEGEDRVEEDGEP